MKGPYQRLKYDLRRLWECPVCKRRERTPGTVTFRHCTCQMKQIDGKPVVMKLIDDSIQRIAPPVAIEHEPVTAPPPTPGPPAADEAASSGQDAGDPPAEPPANG